MAYLHKRVNCFCLFGSLRGGGRIVFASSFDEIVVVWICIDGSVCALWKFLFVICFVNRWVNHCMGE